MDGFFLAHDYCRRWIVSDCRVLFIFPTCLDGTPAFAYEIDPVRWVDPVVFTQALLLIYLGAAQTTVCCIRQLSNWTDLEKNDRYQLNTTP